MSEAPGKKRVSKASKRKAKKMVEESPDDEEEVEEKPTAEEDEDVPAKKRKTKANRLAEMEARAEEEEKEPRGVLYIGHIPEGFFEPQMKQFFGQFGKVTRLRISRSKKSAKCKGYAFVEFEEESVAKIVAETMQGYLLFEKTLVCHLIPREKQHPLLFKGCRRRMLNTSHTRRKNHTKAYNDRPTVEVDGEKLPRQTQRQADRRKRSALKLSSMLANLGVEYDLDGAKESGGAKSQKSSPAAAPVAAKSPKSSPAAPPAVAVAEPARKKKKRKVSA